MKKNVTKNLILVLIISIILNTYSFADSSDIILSGDGAVLIDENTDVILFEQNAHKKLFPASTTKVMTAILAIENANLDSVVTIDEEIVSLTKGSHIALDYDEEMTVSNLLHALLIASANDSAVALAKHTSGSIDAFVELMNAKAEELGAKNTHFANPSGLHDDNHYTTPYDLYLIAKYAMENETFRKIVAMPSYVIPPTNVKEERLIHSTNKFLYGNGKVNVGGEIMSIAYDGVLGVKTGFTDEAKNCLITYAKKDGRGIYSVVLKSDGYAVYSDTYKLLNHGFNDFKYTNIAHKNEFIDNVYLDRASLPYVSTVIDKDISYPVNVSKGEDNIKKEIILNEEFNGSIKKGDALGVVNYYIDDNLIGTANVISTLDVDTGITSFIKNLLSKWYIILIVIYVLFRILQMFVKLKNRKTRRKRRNNYINTI